ncbi:hypothetical protein ABW19_dt0209183 [Dactylella cylindrospora]|nr:hypothetical protein ABW19_dt0209183 [Dactylella cylindrospora]
MTFPQEAVIGICTLIVTCGPVVISIYKYYTRKKREKANKRQVLPLSTPSSNGMALPGGPASPVGEATGASPFLMPPPRAVLRPARARTPEVTRATTI